MPNLDTKAVNSYEEHPIYKYHKDNIKVNLSTDNRTVSNINLNQETSKLVETFKVDIDDYKKIYINSVNAAFCDDETKAMLLAI